MLIYTYQNNRNFNKYLELHVSTCYHYAVRQYLHWDETDVLNYTGDGNLHRIHKTDLIDLLEDYRCIGCSHKFNNIRK